MRKLEVREVESVAQSHIARKCIAKIPTGRSGSGHLFICLFACVFVCLKAPNSLTFVLSRGGCSKTPCLESSQACNCLDHKRMVEMMLCGFRGCIIKGHATCPGSLAALTSSRVSLLGLPLSKTQPSDSEKPKPHGEATYRFSGQQSF